MKNVVGIFEQCSDAERAVARLVALGLPRPNVSLLSPCDGDAPSSVKTTDTEQPGTGAAIGGVVGAATGASAGAGLVALVPGIGPVVAAGWMAMTVLGLLGAAVGGVAGNAIESALSSGLPKDELYVYEDALRRGHAVVIALVSDDAQAEQARHALELAGAYDFDAARERWWLGIRPEDEAYDEPEYRHGVEAAFHPDLRGKAWHEAEPELAKRHGDKLESEAFRRGYDYGRTRYEERATEAAGTEALRDMTSGGTARRDDEPRRGRQATRLGHAH